MSSTATLPYDSILVVSFGGPEGPDEVLPFLENVLRGKNVPRQRMLEVAEHYQAYGGVSPINAQNRALIAALTAELAEHGPPLPIYWGNRNWHPLLPETLRQMAADGRRHALAFFTSAYSSYSGCRQYRENILTAQTEVGAEAPQVDKLRVFYNHPGFIEPVAQLAAEAVRQFPEQQRAETALLFSAHSIPLSMAEKCRYQPQLEEASRLVAERLAELRGGRADWELVFQSRSGPPTQPWLEPDVCDRLRVLREQGVENVVLVPIGFISDHMEVIYDLDHEAQQVAAEIGLNMVRAATVGTHPRFVTMIRELIQERMGLTAERLALGTCGPSHDVCPLNCCLPPERPQMTGRPT